MPPFSQDIRKVSSSGGKRRAAPATAATIESSTVYPKKSGDGTKTPLEGRQSVPSERAMWGVWRSGLAALAPVTGAGSSGDASFPRHNRAVIAASPSWFQTRYLISQIKAVMGGTRASTCRTVAQSPGSCTHLSLPLKSPRSVSEASHTDLIVNTTGEGIKRPARNTGSVGDGLHIHISPKSL